MSRSIRAVLILAAVLGIAAAVLLGVFRIQAIEITGNERHSSEQIRDDLIYDFYTKNTLYFCWKYREAVPSEDTPYLASVQAKMISPTSVLVIVKENTLIGRLDYNGQNVYFDSEGNVQEISSNIYEEVPLVTGLTIEEPVMYQKLTMDNPATLRTMLSITQLLIKSGLIPDYVSFDDSGNMTLSIGPVLVELGQDEYLEEKIANLVQLYPQLNGQSGTLNMEGFTGKNEAITFKAGNEELTEQETEGDESGDTEGGEESGDGTSQTLAGVGVDISSGNEGSSGNEDADDNTGADDTAGDEDDNQPAEEVNSSLPLMVFDSSGNLHYDAHVVGGNVVDSYGNPIAGCYVNDAGNVVDAYWNEIDPNSGTVLNI